MRVVTVDSVVPLGGPFRKYNLRTLLALEGTGCEDLALKTRPIGGPDPGLQYRLENPARCKTLGLHQQAYWIGVDRVPFMKSEGGDREMKCPKCGRYSLHVTGKGVGCRTCGYELSPGETDKYRLFQLLKEEEKKPR